MTFQNGNFGIDNLVAQLRDIRVRSLEERDRRDKPPKLPSRKVLADILEGLSGALFPNRLGRPDLRDEGIDYFVGNTLDKVLRQLYEQIHRELHFMAEHQGLARVNKSDVYALTREFASQLPRVRELLDSDIEAAYQGDPAARTSDETLVCYPGIHAMIHQRLAHELYRLGAPLTARMMTELAHSATGIDIHPGAQIGESFFVDHGTGVVIGETTIIGSRVCLYQAVTFEHTRYQPAPAKFEAGTGTIADAVGLGAALEYVQKIGIQNIAVYEHDLLAYAMEALRRIDGLTLIGTAKEKTSVLSFVLQGHTTQQVGEALNKVGIAVRSGHHCAQPILRRFGVEATVRPSLAFYNTHDEVDHLVSTVRKIKSGTSF